MATPSLPYIDHVLQRLAAGDLQLERCFGTHVHWGYWQDPDTTGQRECIFPFPSRPAFLREVQRVLRPGGRLVLSDFVPCRPLALALRALQSLRGAPFSSGTYGPIDCRWDRGRYARQARRHRLQLRNDADITAHTLPSYSDAVACGPGCIGPWPGPGGRGGPGSGGPGGDPDPQ